MDEDDECFLSASHWKCILLSGTECHIVNYLLTKLARAVPGNIGPRSFSYVFVRFRTVTTSGQYSPVRPSRSVSKRLLIYRILSCISIHVLPGNGIVFVNNNNVLFAFSVEWLQEEFYLSSFKIEGLI